MGKVRYDWTDNPTESGASRCDTDVLNECLMHLKYSQEKGDGFPLFTPMMFDKILQGEEAVGWALQGTLVTMTYPDAVNKIIEEYTQGTSTEYRGIQCIKGINGHIIADIDKKDAVDTLYFDTGIADIYVLDSVNKQFYLPRNKYFTQLTNNTDKVNDFVVAGVPNITGWFGKTQNIGNYHSANGALQVASVEKMTDAASSGNSTAATYNFNASLSNSIYGKSGTVQPQASLKLLYYKVGHTIANEAEIDVANLTNDVLNKADIDLGNINSEGKSFASGLGMPSGVKIYNILGAPGSSVPSRNYQTGVGSKLKYTPLANGYIGVSITARVYDNGVSQGIVATANDIVTVFAHFQYNFHTDSFYFPVKKGETYTFYISYQTGGNSTSGLLNESYFEYAQGEI